MNENEFTVVFVETKDAKCNGCFFNCISFCGMLNIPECRKSKRKDKRNGIFVIKGE